MDALTEPSATRNAGLYLRFLLQHSYRHRWNRPEFMERRRQLDVHHGAVAQVLALHLQDYPRPGRPGDREILGSQLTALVSRALRGEKLSQQTLELFISAFNMADEHAESLRLQLAGLEPSRVIVGDLPPPEQVPNYRTREYEVLMLHEHHWLGSDGLPARHRTQINIRSRVDGLSTYQYRFDTNTAEVRGRKRQGATTGPIYSVGGGIFAVDFLLDRPLARGESDYLEFWALFRYEAAPPREMRRATHERIRDFYLRVEFSPGRLPGRVWWAEWSGYLDSDDEMVAILPYDLGGRLFVHRHLESMEQAVVGFAWDW